MHYDNTRENEEDLDKLKTLFETLGVDIKKTSDIFEGMNELWYEDMCDFKPKKQYKPHSKRWNNSKF